MNTQTQVTKRTANPRPLTPVPRALAKYALVFIALIIALAPVYWMLTISLKSEVEQFSVPPRWFSFTPTFFHYREAFVERSFGQYLLTSAVSVFSKRRSRIIRKSGTAETMGGNMRVERIHNARRWSSRCGRRKRDSA